MSSDTVALKLTERKEIGKAIKELRRQGLVPANIYERGKESQAVTANFAEITKVYKMAGKHTPVELDVEGKIRLAMIKEVDVKVGKGSIIHVAFHAVNKNEIVEAEVPVRLEGEVPAEKISLLVLQNLDTVVVQAKPADLPSELTIDGAKLADDGDKVTVADIELPKNVEMVTDADIMVFAVETPKDQIAAADAALEESSTIDEVEVSNDKESASESDS